MSYQYESPYMHAIERANYTHTLRNTITNNTIHALLDFPDTTLITDSIYTLLLMHPTKQLSMRRVLSKACNRFEDLPTGYIKVVPLCDDCLQVIRSLS